MRDRFVLPPGVLYLDGNSLGALPAGVADALVAVGEEWGDHLIEGWGADGWWDRPCSLGARLAPLLGAAGDEVVVCDSTSVNIFKAVAAALALVPGRRVVVAERATFPGDLYVLEGLLELLGGYELRLVDGPFDPASPGAGIPLESAIDDATAVVLATHVDFRSAHLHDMRALTELAHRHGAVVVWDLAHSAGAVALELDDCAVDFAVGCTYKYLNGGPGAPAFLYAARRHLASARQPLAGWHGHLEPFAFSPAYKPATGIRRFLTGSPPIVAFAALDAALAVWDEVEREQVFAKGRALSALLIDLVDDRCPELEVATPRNPARRGSHVALRHGAARALVAALGRRKVIADFREPDLVRIALTPLYQGFTDVWDAVTALRAVLDDLGGAA